MCDGTQALELILGEGDAQPVAGGVLLDELGWYVKDVGYVGDSRAHAGGDSRRRRRYGTLDVRIFEARWRGVESIAMTATVAVVAATGAGALVMLRMMSTTVALSFILIVSVAIVAALVTAVYGGQTIDPNIGTLVGALLAGLIAGVATTEIDLATGLFAAVAVAAGLIAGRVFGSMIRTGSIVHTVRLPGQLTPLDGLWLAVPLYWLVLVLLG